MVRGIAKSMEIMHKCNKKITKSEHSWTVTNIHHYKTEYNINFK